MESPDLGPSTKQKADERSESEKKNLSTEMINDREEYVKHFAMLYNDRRFSDLILRVDDHRFHAHKFLLIVASSVFEAMLNDTNWRECNQPEITLTEEEECVPVFGDFLRYMYTGCVQLTTDIVLPILLLADKYGLKVLQLSCVQYMLRHIVETPDSNRTLTWYQYAKMTNQTELAEKCRLFILSNFDIILQAPDWINMSAVEVTEFLSSSEMVVESELALWKRVEVWLKHNSTTESNAVENLELVLPLMRFTLIPPKCLAEFESSPLYRSHSQLFEPKLNHAYRHHSLSLDFGASQPSKEPFRNYYSDDYSICHGLNVDKISEVKKIDSKISKDCSIPTIYVPNTQCPASKHQVMFHVDFYPKGFYVTYTLYGSYMGRQTNDTTLRISRCQADAPPMNVEISIVFFSVKNNIRYVSHTCSMQHQFRVDSGDFTVHNVINLTDLLAEDSNYLTYGHLDAKLFIKVQETLKAEASSSTASILVQV